MWFSALKDKGKEDLHRRSMKQDMVDMDRLIEDLDARCDDWTCTLCQSKNDAIYYENRQQIPGPKCRCCGSQHEETSPSPALPTPSPALPTTLHQTDQSESPFSNPSTLDQRIVKQWSELLRDINENPEDNKCLGNDTLVIDSCPMIQKFFFVMRYYHLYAGKPIVGVEDEEQYRIDSVVDLVEGLQDLSLIKLVDMFEHISTVHRDSQMFDHFIKNIGKCDESECEIMHRNRARDRVATGGISHDETLDGTIRHRGRFSNSSISKPRVAAGGPNHVEDEEKLDPVERNTLPFFDKWHSFLFHTKFETKHTSISFEHQVLIDEEEMEMDFEPQNISGEYTSKFVDYGFGVWIDYTTHRPNFESMKEEVTGNEICTISSNQWQNTLNSALTHLESHKVKTDKRYTAKRADEKYGIGEKGQLMGTENVVAILLYCNYTDLQRRFTETFRTMQDDDTDEMIVERHCHNYYWFGRCALFTLTPFICHE